MSNDQTQHEDRDDEEIPTAMDRARVALFLVAIGPFGLILAPKLEDPKVFAWGVGTTLLYVGVLGLVKTLSLPNIVVSLGLEPHLDTAAQHIEAASDAIVAAFQLPETYAILFAAGVIVVLVGFYRMSKWEPDGLPEGDYDGE